MKEWIKYEKDDEGVHLESYATGDTSLRMIEKIMLNFHIKEVIT